MRKIFQKFRKFILAVIAALTFVVTQTGCFILTEDELEISLRGLLRIQDGLTESQVRWILFIETMMIIFLILLIVLITTIFRRYRRVSKRIAAVKRRERALMEENEMLNRINIARTEFLQNMSHDFKTPLTVIGTSVINAMDMLDYEYDVEELRESLILAQSEIIRISRVLDKAVKQTALLSNRPGTEPIHLARFLRKVVKTYDAYLDKNGNALITQLPKALPYARCNADTLLNIFSNLISNANRFTRDGVITISAEITDEQLKQDPGSRFITIKVSDTGKGIEPDVLPNIFKRGVSSADRTGLGLSICKAAIESFGGTITIDSEYGKGTDVIFTIPVNDDSTDADKEIKTKDEH